MLGAGDPDLARFMLVLLTGEMNFFKGHIERSFFWDYIVSRRAGR